MKNLISISLILLLFLANGCVDKELLRPSIGTMKAEVNGSLWEAKTVFLSDNFDCLCGNFLVFQGYDGKQTIRLNIIDKIGNNESRFGSFVEQKKELLNKSILNESSFIGIDDGRSTSRTQSIPEIYISTMEDGIVEGIFNGIVKNDKTGENIKVVNGYFKIKVK